MKSPWKQRNFRKNGLQWARNNGLLTSSIGVKNKTLWNMIVARVGIEDAVAVTRTTVRVSRMPDAEPRKRRRADPEFYNSREWKALRYAALQKHGARCQCCGATRDDGVTIHVDHIKPRSKYPELELRLDNLQILCEPCNMGKGAWDETDWRSGCDWSEEAEALDMAFENAMARH